MRTVLYAVVVAASGVVAAGAAEPPLAGCYERVYDAAHLAKHKGQLVMRATLSVRAADRDVTWIADGTLKLWIRGKDKNFDSHGACSASGDGLLCGGSLSAAEAEDCKSRKDGIHECRIDAGGQGSFKIESKPGGVLVSIRERLELVQAPYDSGPFLYFSPGNAENHAFLLGKTACK